jgi:hypothetical protein
MSNSRYARNAGPVSSERVDRTLGPKLPKVRPPSSLWSGSVHDKDRASEEPCASKGRKHGFEAEAGGVILPSTAPQLWTTPKSITSASMGRMDGVHHADRKEWPQECAAAANPAGCTAIDEGREVRRTLTTPSSRDTLDVRELRR